MRSCGAACVATDSHFVACKDNVAFADMDSWQMAVTDCDIAMYKTDVFASPGILACFWNHTVEHGKDILISRSEVDARERILYANFEQVNKDVDEMIKAVFQEFKKWSKN